MKGEDHSFEEKVNTLHQTFSEITREQIITILKLFEEKPNDVMLAEKYIKKHYKKLAESGYTHDMFQLLPATRTAFSDTALLDLRVPLALRAEMPRESGGLAAGSLSALFPNLEHVQEMSHRRTENPTQVYNMLQEVLGHHQGLVLDFKNDVVEQTRHVKPEIIADIVKLLTTDDAPVIEGMFEQFNKKPPLIREELYFAFRLYMLVQGFCCICHDRLARAVKDFLIGILSDYRVTVGGQANQNLRLLYKSLSDQFTVSFSKGSGVTVSQATCRLAGENTIKIFREWLTTTHEIVLDDPVIIHMKTRIETTAIIADILSRQDINSEEDMPLLECITNITDALFDAAKNVLPAKSVGDAGPTSIDGAALPIDAPLLTFQSCLFNLPPQRKKNQTSGSAFDSMLVPTLVPRACLWDSRDDRKYTDTEKIITPLSMGPVSLVSLLAFDPDIVNKKFMTIVQGNTSSTLWKPAVLMYGQVDHFIKDDTTRDEANDFYNYAFKDFLEEVRIHARDEAERLGLLQFCSGLDRDVPQRVIINGNICVLLSVSFGSMSVNMTTNIIKPVIPSVELGIRGGGGCSKKKLNGVAYVGQNAERKGVKLVDKSGGPTPLGKMVATTGLMIKQWGDEAKIYVLLLIQALTGWPIGMLGTVDIMAGAEFDLFGPTMVVGPSNITVRRPASSLRASGELLAKIAKLQAIFQVYKEGLTDGDIHKDLKKKFDVFCDVTLSRTLLPCIEKLSRTHGNDISEVPSLISTLVFCDVLSCRESLVSSEKMLEIITTCFNRSIHGATSSEDDFPDLFLQRDTTNRLIGCIGTYESSLEANHKQWTYEGADRSLVPTCDFTVYAERTIDFEISNGCMKRSPDSIFGRVKELIELEGDVFTLLIQRVNFERRAKEQSRFRSSSRSALSLYDYDKIIKEALDPMILTVLQKYIIENTTGVTLPGRSESWRDMCLSIVKRHFVCEPLDIFQDSIGLSQESARVDYIEGHNVGLDVDDRGISCSVPNSPTNYPKRSKQLKIHKQEKSQSAAPAPAAPSVFTRSAAAAAAAGYDQFADLYLSGKKQLEANIASEKIKRKRTGGTRKKSKIQKRKITRKYKGKTSRHNHTIKNRHIRNYSLRNKQ